MSLTLSIGDVVGCSIGGMFGSIVNVRVTAIPSIGFCINQYGTRMHVVEAVEEQIIDSYASDLIKQAKVRLDADRHVLRLNLEDGRIGRDSLLVYSSSLDEIDGDLFEVFQSRWRSKGNCPRCGFRGEWVALALRCDIHGVYGG